MDGIQSARATLPRCWFDAGRCAKGLGLLRQYRADYDDKAKTFRDTPAPRFHQPHRRRLPLSVHGLARGVASVAAKPKNPLRSLNDYTLNELFEIAAREERERRNSIRI